MKIKSRKNATIVIEIKKVEERTNHTYSKTTASLMNSTTWRIKPLHINSKKIKVT